MFSWVRMRETLDNSSNRIYLEIRDKDNGTSAREGFRVGMSTQEEIVVRTSSSASSAAAQPDSANFSAGNWYSTAGVFESASSRLAYVSGVQVASNTTSLTPTAALMDCITIGSGLVSGSTFNGPWDGDIHWPAIWNAALSADEVQQLELGESPRNIRPQSLVFFVEKDDHRQIMLDVVGGYHATLRGTSYPIPDIPPQVAARLPRRSARIYAFPAATGATGTIAATNAADTASAAGKVGTTGSGTPTNAADTASGAGKVGHVGTGTPTSADDTADAAGTVGSEAITGTGAPTGAADTSTASGTVGAVGTGAATSAADTATAAGTVGHVGTGAPTSDGDTASGSGTAGSASESRPLGLSSWLDLDTETADTRRDRIRRDRERMGIVAPEAVPAPEKSQERTKRPSKPIAEGNAFAPPAEPVARSANATRQVLSLADARAQKEADAARILAVLEFEAEQRRLKAIRYRTALLLLAAEA